ncbi:hypothetical protein QJS04_geneDACA013304 [Acorus gramineus]|uniref:glucan endo-1,3-beta-D-glucosidase n=1 Tax=Acorus gramineus TaxID=55184 RepID=A0AAV9BBS3_ACOGR|nr:hypothetical protein QJS04_geneDACA013304 [Acorus gramineus]
MVDFDLRFRHSITDETGPQTHTISSFDDLSLTLDIPPSLRFYLTRGSPYVTLSTQSTKLSISTVHAVLNHQSNDAQTKHKLLLNNGQTWLCYASSPLRLSSPNVSSLESQDGFAGTVRFAALPSSDGDCEAVLDRFGSCYPVSGEAVYHRTFCVEYKWETRGWSGGDLLMLAHPLHLKMLCASDGRDLTVIDGFRYESIDARAARLALIAEEVRKPELIPAVHHFLRDSITPWLDGSFPSNGFLYDPKWGGLVTKAGLSDSGADFGFGIYNDHHYHLGYFAYAIAVLVKLDPAWARAYRPQCYALVADFMSLGRRSTYTKLRCFDAWKLHSWAGGLTEFADGRNQESTSEAVNAYYSAALMGLAFGDAHLASVGATLAAFEIEAARMWWHVREGERGMYTEEFVAGNRVVGVLWANKRDAGLWFAPPEWRECRLGIQLLPLAPITEALFADVGFARELVRWAMPALDREGVGEGWKGFIYALEGVYDKEAALEKVRRLNGYDDGNSLSNLLWWLHSRGDGEGSGGSWFGQYCH